METLLIILFSLAALCKALADSCAHGKNRWSKAEGDFFGHKSDERKWADPQLRRAADLPIKVEYGPPFAPDTWYYRFFKLKYKERFPGSATIFVAVTDCWHLANSFMVTFVSVGVAFLTPHPVWAFVVLRALWGIAFSVGYKLFSI